MKTPSILILLLYLVFTHLICGAQSFSKQDLQDFAELDGVNKVQIKALKSCKRSLSVVPVLYSEALSGMLPLQASFPDFDPLNYHLALCYLNTYNKVEALPLLLKCDDTVDSLYYYTLAKAYHYSDDFENAKKYYTLFASELSKETSKEFSNSFDFDFQDSSIHHILNRQIVSCDIALASINPSQLVDFTSMYSVNGTEDDVYPLVLSPTQVLFSSNRSYEGEDGYRVYELFNDLENAFGIPHLSPLFDSEKKDELIVLSMMSETSFLCTMPNKDDDIFIVSNDDSGVHRHKFPDINSKRAETSACLLNDTTIVFSSNRGSNSSSGDLYISFKLDAKNWTKPELVNSPLNTDGREDVVCFYNGDLYYTSNGEGTIGGFDVFKVTYNGANSWDAPVNLGYPINTANDDYGYCPNSTTTGLYWGIRPEGNGFSDIYKVIITELQTVETKSEVSY